ncbi:acetyl-CoA C-acetyltransferase [Blastococcus sp. PRF04-17]|uniref:acetyl-CoA C-acetyltransferase n=1 Tax=Blastococcus sp. PRF04-17 TaxID=2933797 RepID=UPI001FF51374|nr:acetyl-CoA C-acetyltransferase [Blastococcus sp. PRF04-17]UOY04093.1 acetyl-CoA C-acetyltransferase [Blastococcus sp. PRF04-17]
MPLDPPVDELVTIDVAQSDSAVCVTAVGEIDSTSAPVLRQKLDAVLESGLPELTVDLGGVTFLDSAGLCVLAATHRRAVRQGMRMRVLASSRAVIRPLQITGLWELLEAEQVEEGSSAARGTAPPDAPFPATRPAPPPRDGRVLARLVTARSTLGAQRRRSRRSTCEKRSSASPCGPRSGVSADRCGTCRPRSWPPRSSGRCSSGPASPESVDDVLLGHSYPTMDAPALGRVAALDAGLPVTASGLQIDRRCGSGLQAVLYAAMQVQSGAMDVVLAGGAESMSNAPFYSSAMRWGVKAGPGVLLQDGLSRGRVTAGGQFHPVPGGMLETAENLRREYKISREEQDEYAVRSHQRAAAATESGTFAEEIVPVTVTSRKAETVVDRDEHIRPDSTVETLARLRPVMGRDDPEATVTAGNASGQNDGAAVAIVTHPDKAAELGLRPLARLVSWGLAGVPPKTMGIGPVPATAKALGLAGITLADVDLIELNEAFAAQVLAVTQEWGFTPADFERTNVNGSGISLGHPVGATGGRILATLLREMDRREVRYGLETMCIGGGQGLAALFERVS